jgi:hypothetical protein
MIIKYNQLIKKGYHITNERFGIVAANSGRYLAGHAIVVSTYPVECSTILLSGIIW